MNTRNTLCLRSWIKACALLAAAPAMTHAAPGDLDTSFASKGWTTSTTGALKDATNSAFAAIQQADGKLVAAGSDINGSNNDILIIRYSSTGALDTTFDSDGRVSLVPGSGADNGYAILQQTDAKLVVAGSSALGTGTLAVLARYNLDGSLDSSFGAFGIVKTQIATGVNEARAIVQQPDGKLVIAGSGTSTNSDVILARYNSDGSLDSSFGTDGRVQVGVLSSDDQAFALALQSDNKLVVAGNALNGTNTDIALLRFNSNGTLDSSFDSDGKLTLNVGINAETLLGADDNAFGVTQQTDGKLLITGSSSNGSNSDTLLIRFNADGTLDNSFGSSGIVQTTVHSKNDEGKSIKVQTDGKILIAGYASNGSNNDFAFLRYNTNGTLDTAFNTDGIAPVAIGSSSDIANALVLQQDGKIVAAGSANMTNGDFALARVDSSGNTDNSFDGDGKTTTTGGAAESKANSVLSQSDGKVVVAGYSVGVSGTTPRYDVTLARYAANGQLDTTFSGDGIQTAVAGSVSAYALDVLQQGDGKIVTAGYKQTTASNKDLFLTRYNTDGSADTTFGSSGKSTAVFNTTLNDGMNAIIQLQSGQLMGAGFVWSGTGATTSDFAITLFRVDGGIDNKNFNAGKVTTPIGSAADIANDLIEQTDGKIVAVGSSNNSSNNLDVAVVRYEATGGLDNTFATGGKFTLDIDATDQTAYSVTQQRDGKLLIAGSSDGAFMIARLNTDGSLDTGFAATGYTVIPVGTDASTAYTVIEQPDGKLVIGGNAVNAAGNNAGGVVRLNSDGSLDTSFGSAGKAIASTDFNSITRGIALQRDGKYLLTGNTTAPTSMLTMRVQVEDTDADGFGDNVDNCPAITNAGQENADNDAFGNACDDDDDNDGVLDINDAFPLNAAESQDTDGDGVGNNGDSCPSVANGDQANLDGDALGDACDGDIDGDGVINAVDSNPLDNSVTAEISLPLNQNYGGSGVAEQNNVD